MCHQHKELHHLDPAAISSTCLMSLQQPSGILLLEEGLLHSGGQEEPAAKRSRGRKEIPPDTNKWIHLARFYTCVDLDGGFCQRWLNVGWNKLLSEVFVLPPLQALQVSGGL